jgi:hypothetical protein
VCARECVCVCAFVLHKRARAHTHTHTHRECDLDSAHEADGRAGVASDGSAVLLDGSVEGGQVVHPPAVLGVRQDRRHSPAEVR